jgi:hypothetical protein
MMIPPDVPKSRLLQLRVTTEPNLLVSLLFFFVFFFLVESLGSRNLRLLPSGAQSTAD